MCTLSLSIELVTLSRLGSLLAAQHRGVIPTVIWNFSKLFAIANSILFLVHSSPVSLNNSEKAL